MKKKKSILFLLPILVISITLLVSGCWKKTAVNPQPNQQNQINNTSGQLPGQLTNSDNENINSDGDLSGDDQQEIKKIMTIEEIQEKLKKFDSLQEEQEETNLDDKDIEEFK